METTAKNQEIILKFSQDSHILTQMAAFLLDRKAQGFAAGTIYFYQKKLNLFSAFCETQLVTQITDITPDLVRLFLLTLEQQGHNPGGIHACYRALRAFLRWWETELEPEGWKNPVKKVKAPKVPTEPLEPAGVDVVQAMINTCEKGTFYGERDRAMLLALLDTGARAQEFLDIQLKDIHLTSGDILIRQGKGGKPRTVCVGSKSRKAIRAYLKRRQDASESLWTSQNGEPMTYTGLRAVLRRRAAAAHVEEPTLHSFRRYFALTMLRKGVDVYTLAKLMGHSDIQVLRHYLKQTDDDVKEAHRRASPVDSEF